MNVGLAELIILLFVLLMSVVPLALLVVALLDAVKYEDATWQASGQNKVLWVVLIVLLGCLGPILYLTVTKPRLRAVQPSP